jgi:hypothetical protein
LTKREFLAMGFGLGAARAFAHITHLAHSLFLLRLLDLLLVRETGREICAPLPGSHHRESLTGDCRDLFQDFVFLGQKGAPLEVGEGASSRGSFPRHAALYRYQPAFPAVTSFGCHLKTREPAQIAPIG